LPAVPRHLAVFVLALLAPLAAACGGSSSNGATTPAPATATATASATPAQRFTPLDPAKTYVAKVTTDYGSISITLDAKQAPKTGGSFKYLADKRFYDGLTFHRIVPDFVIQGGDPKGDGSGGPGYTVVEAPPSNLVYKPGVVAMAKTQDEAPGTSGSQFFIVIGAQAQQLTPDYALLGTVTKGMNVAEAIGRVKADPNTGVPSKKVTIESIRVTEK
jgi:cyclophilin family peptidyl-prolyl cis-trans isomerase